jgi:hypothetical protein
MANHCENILIAQHQQPAIVDAVVKAFRDGRFFSAIAPEPEYAPAPSDWQPEWAWQPELDWQHKNWGCSSEPFGRCGLHHARDSIVLTFSTRWTPPLPIYEKMCAAGWRVTAYYNEIGCAFCGRYSDGVDSYFEYDKLNSVGVRRTLPPDIDQVFRLSLRLLNEELESLEKDVYRQADLIQDFYRHD